MSDRGVLTDVSCLVRYGRMGWVAMFAAEDDVVGGHGARVVVRTERGEELGEILSDVPERLAVDVTLAGRVLRAATEEDEARPGGDAESLDRLIDRVRRDAVDLEPVDAEWLVGGRTAVIYCLGEVGPESERVAVDLSKKTGYDIRLAPLLDPEPGSCGGGGGCGSGGCGA